MNKDIRGEGVKTLPSIFDIGLYAFSFLAPIIFWFPLQSNMMQGMFFVFGTFTLLGLSFLCKKENDYHNGFLTFFILWSLINVFIHTFKASLTQGSTAGFINYCLMSEGFIYILCGCILFHLIVSYKRKFDIFYPLLAINILNLFFAVTQKMGMNLVWSNNSTICGMMGVNSQLTLFSAMSVLILGKRWVPLTLIPLACMVLGYSYTGMMAFYVVLIWYFLRTKQNIRMTIWVILGLIFIYFNKDFMWVKFQIRLEQWATTIREISLHPFIGNGFDNTFNNNMIYSKLNGGMTFRHNDFLNIARDLGLIFTTMLIFGIGCITDLMRKDRYWVAILILIIGCCFQTNFYWARIASIGIILLALEERKNVEAEVRKLREMPEPLASSV